MSNSTGFTFPNANLTVEITTKYNYLARITKLNQTQDKIFIEYRRLDEETKGLLKDAIAKVAHNYSYPSVTDPKIKSELERLYKDNMSDQIEIDYSALKTIDSDGINTNDYAVILRNYIQDVLNARRSKMYLNMTLNPTV